MSKREEFWARVNEKGESLNQQTKGILGQTEWKRNGFWGESNAKGFDGEQTLLNEGKSKEFYSK